MISTCSLERPSRTLLATALLAVLGTTRADAAVTLNERGLGQVLLYPYYTVNAGNDTYVSVTNTTNRGKALKLRFRESRNSRPTLEFSLYLSPYDVWTGAVFALDAEGPANLVTFDASCTVPAIRSSTQLPQTAGGARYVPFRNFTYSGPSADGGDPALARSREGHIELIEMGTLKPGPAATQVLEEVTHTSATGNPNTGVPVNCNRLIANWDNIEGAWGGANGNRQLDIDLPTGGLYGTAQIINVANGTLHAYAAEAIEGFYGGTAAPGGLHQAPGNGKPDLADGSDGSPTLRSRVTRDDGSPVVSSWRAGTSDAVSAVLMTPHLDGDFDLESAIAAQTEWVITFPTKSYSSDRSEVVAPFTRTFPGQGKACERIITEVWDRDPMGLICRPGIEPGDTSVLPPCYPTSCTTDFPESPPVPPGIDCQEFVGLCFAAGVLSFGQPGVNVRGIGNTRVIPSEIFGSTSALNRSPNNSGARYDRGHARFRFDRPETPGPDNVLVSIEGHRYLGLPAIGFVSSRYANGNAQPGRLAHYSGAVRLTGAVAIAEPLP